jgi:hypothetical protein
MNNMFEDIDPWERLMILQQRVEMLERIQEELIRSVTIQQEHMKNVNLAVMSLQKLYMENQQ